SGRAMQIGRGDVVAATAVSDSESRNVRAAVRLNDDAVIEHKAAAHAAQAEMLRAEARGDRAGIESALDEAMDHARILMGSPNGGLAASDDPEIRELYRSVITAYESHYGTIAPTSAEYGEIFRRRRG